MRIFLLLVFGVLIQLTAMPQASVAKEGLIKKLREIRNEVQLVSSNDETVLQVRNNLRLVITDIIVRLDVFEGTFPEGYLSSLAKLLIMSRDATTNNNTGEQKSMLEHISLDLQIKFKDRANTLGSQFFNELLPVSVACTRNGKAANNLRVRYASLGYKVDTSKPDGSFGILTSPANDNMIPGYYQVWITEDGSYKVLRSWSGEISPDKNNVLQFDIQ